MTAPLLMGDMPGRVLRGALSSFLGLQNRPDAPAYGVEGWSRFLDWARAALGAESAFAIDPSGLVIAARGELDQQTLDELAARMGVAVTHAHAIAADPDEELGLVVRYRGRWLTVLRLGGDPVFKIGLVGAEPVHPALMQPDNLVAADWGALLGWAVAPEASDSGFLVDDSGLVVASLGALDDLAVQGIGGRLTLLIAQVDRVSSMGKSSWVAVHHDQWWLMATRVTAGKNKHLVFGARSRRPVHPARVMDLKRVLTLKLRKNPLAF